MLQSKERVAEHTLTQNKAHVCIYKLLTRDTLQT